MAVRQPKRIATTRERQAMDRVQRAVRSYPRWDRHGGYLDACAELARETGGDAASIYSEWEHEAQTRLYGGVLEVEDAEIEALQEIQRRFRRAS